MTDFSQYSHRQLVNMLFASDPGSVRSAAEVWDHAGGSLAEQANNLDRQLNEFEGGWTGGAANQYKVMVNDLAEGIRRVAGSAMRMRDLTYDSAEALDTARAEMPQPVDVPDVSAATVTMATGPMEVPADASPAQLMSMQQQRSDAVTAVQQQQQASAASDAAHAKAIQVMNTLAGHYSVNEQSIPDSPDAAQAPTVPQPGTQQPQPVAPIVAPGTGDGTDPNNPTGVVGTPQAPVDGSTGTPKPLFGNMFTAGLAAASAAAFGRFGSIMPRLPGFMKNREDAKKGLDGKSRIGADAKLGAGFGGAGKFDPAKFGGGAGIGGGGVGGGGIGGGFGGDLPKADPGMSGGGGSAAGAAIGAATGAAVGAARGMGGMPMMPMMPMTGAGMGDMGGRRVPPWLVETEDVWGEPSVVAPGLIGHENG